MSINWISVIEVIINGVVGAGSIALFLWAFGERLFFKRWQHKHELNIENQRSQNRTSEAESSAANNADHATMADVRNMVYSRHSNRQSLRDKRSIEAIDGIWTAAQLYTPVKTIIPILQRFDIDHIQGQIIDQTHDGLIMQEFFKTIWSSLKIDDINKGIKGQLERPFISPETYSIFTIYLKICGAVIVYTTVFKDGIDSKKLVNIEEIAEAIKQKFPFTADGFEKFGNHWIFSCLEVIEEQLIFNLQKEFNGDALVAVELSNAKFISEEAYRIASEAKLVKNSAEMIDLMNKSPYFP